MNKIALAALGAAIMIATTYPVLACGGGGYAYRAPHHVRAAVVHHTSTPTKVEAAPAALKPTTEPIQTLSSLSENAKS